MNDELEIKCERMTVAYFKVLFQHLPGKTVEKNENVDRMQPTSLLLTAVTSMV
jgi:hypothetical protein